MPARAVAALACLSLLAAAPAQRSPAQAPAARSAAYDFARADAIVRDEMARQHIPGVSLTILRAGKIVHRGDFGLADIATGTPVTRETAFNIGSISKGVLAAGILLLVEDGKLALDAPVSRYLPDAPANWSEITLRRMLSHTAGLVREAPGFAPDRIQPDIGVIRSAYPLPLIAPPGTRMEYSNVGYFVLAELIARASGKPWPDFIAERIFVPLGMGATRPTTAAGTSQRATGYAWNAGRYEISPGYRALRPSGAFTSTAPDLARWESGLAKGTILRPESRAAMWTPAMLAGGAGAGYGFGWRIETVEGRREIAHGGSLPGFRSYYGRYPEQQLAIIVLTNNGGAEPRDIVRAIAGDMLR